MSASDRDQKESRASARSKVGQIQFDGKTAYVKQYLPGGRGRDEASTRARLQRETDTITRLERSGLFVQRLGTLRLLDVDPERLQIVTEQVPGKPLNFWSDGPYRRAVGRDPLRAVFLAGRWLRHFQMLPTIDVDATRLNSFESDDLHEYCRIRLDSIAERGYAWEEDGFRVRLNGTLSRLLALMPPDDKRTVLGHGDFHAGNMIWDGSKLTVIDFGMVSLKMPLADVASFLHRLDLLRVYRPWRRGPPAVWKRAFLRGYGRHDAERSPGLQLQMIRLWLCRLHHFVGRPAPTIKDRLHNAWIRRCARARLIAAVSSG